VKQEPIETSVVKSEKPDKIEQMVIEIKKKNLSKSVTDVKQKPSKAVKKKSNLGFHGMKKKYADDDFSMCSDESGASAADQINTEQEQEKLRKESDMQEVILEQRKERKQKKTTLKSKVKALNKTPRNFYKVPSSAKDPVSRQLQQV
jgi:hypothetical protein